MENSAITIANREGCCVELKDRESARGNRTVLPGNRPRKNACG